jgi:hypothetical protein
MSRLAEALSQMSDDFLQSVIRQTRVDKLEASGKLASSYRTEKVDNGFILVNDAKYSKAVLKTGVDKRKARPSSDNVIAWMKKRGLRPYVKLPNGATRFSKITDSSWKKAAFAIINYKGRNNVGIYGGGLIKRFGYKGSDTLQKVVDTKIKKWAVDISKAFKEDLLTQMKAEISFKDLNI